MNLLYHGFFGLQSRLGNVHRISEKQKHLASLQCVRLSKNPVLKQLKAGFFVFSMKLSRRSKFKLHPVCYLGQALIRCEPHCMLFFCICKDVLNGFFSSSIPFLVQCCVPIILYCISGLNTWKGRQMATFFDKTKPARQRWCAGFCMLAMVWVCFYYSSSKRLTTMSETSVFSSMRPQS